MEFRNKYWYLSNMYPCQVVIAMDKGNYTFTCAESAFQACKNQDFVDQFLGIDGFEAKRKGRKVKIASMEEWDKIKDDVMEYVVCAKFEQHPELMSQLISIQGDIMEENTWKDKYWGVVKTLDHVDEQTRQPIYKLVGENKLGKILEKIRAANMKSGMNE